MSLRSMTGFGHGVAGGRGVRVEVELGSVNRRQFELRATFYPRILSVLEPRIAEVVREAVLRGAVTCTVRAEVPAESRGRGVRVDAAVAAAYAKEFAKLARTLGMSGEVPLQVLASLPGVTRFEEGPDDPEDIWPVVRRALSAAVRGLTSMRDTEGQALKRDLVRRLASLEKHRSGIFSRSRGAPARFRAALAERLAKASAGIDADDPALMREVALLADRCDVTEELVRLKSHISQAEQQIEAGGAVGRTLDFVCQEMFREVNTIGSKSGDARVTAKVIAFKSLLETFREQVQNLE
ncbi:MAG: YicC family protein [Lentisphaerae bacterium]|nr:YicC family protein [Lentisphaerota bacterium]